MLFKTVYGAELDSIYFLIQNHDPIEEKEILNFNLCLNNNKLASPANIFDALSFLQTSNLIYKDKNNWRIFKKIKPENFKIKLIKNIRNISLNNNSNKNLDSYYFNIIDELFIKQDIQFRSDIYQEVNAHYSISFSKEKINSWKRTLEFLEIAKRGYGGLLLIYNPYLILNIIDEYKWDYNNQGPLQTFLQKHFNNYLPWENKNKEISITLINTFKYLEDKNYINLITKQDLPLKSYFYSRRINWLERRI